MQRLTAISSLRPLRHRAYAWLWSTALVSTIGTWMETVAVGVLITEQTGQAAWTGFVAALAFLPMAVFGPIGGALADRLDRRRYLLALIALQGILAALLALLAATGLAVPAAIAVILLLGGTATALRMPAWQSMLPEVVPEEDLPGAVSLGLAQFNLGRVVGPALAGVVIATGGYALAFGLNALSYAATFGAIFFVQLPRRQGAHLPFLRHLADGFEHARRDPGIATSLGLISVVGLLAAPFIALVPAMAILVWGGGTRETAILVTAQGAGAVLFALAATPLVDRFGRGNVLLGALLALPLALVAYGLAPIFQLTVVCIVLIGGVYLLVLTGLNTVVQLRAAPLQRGRALSLFMVALGGSYPVGAVVQGALSDRWDLRGITVATAALLFLIVLTLRWRRPDLTRALGEMPSPSPFG